MATTILEFLKMLENAQLIDIADWTLIEQFLNEQGVSLDCEMDTEIL